MEPLLFTWVGAIVNRGNSHGVLVEWPRNRDINLRKNNFNEEYFLIFRSLGFVCSFKGGRE